MPEIVDTRTLVKVRPRPTDVRNMPVRTNHPSGSRHPRRGARRGVAIIYIAFVVVALLALVTLSVDYGRVKLVKTELQNAADAAAMAGAAFAKNYNFSSPVYVEANKIASANTADGTPVTLATADVETGVWTASTRTFAANTNAAVCNAVRVTCRRTAATSNPVKLSFGLLQGRTTADAVASAVAVVQNDTSIPYTIYSTMNPWLSGMPAGSIANNRNNPHNNPDYAGTTNDPDPLKRKASPQHASAMPVTSGKMFTFDGVNGGANNMPSSQLFDADGNTGWIVNNQYSMNYGPENGMADLVAPINSLVGVFLDDNAPNTTAYPSGRLDFSTSASRDFATLAPALKQPFFIGDGRKSDGTVQLFKAPQGATRLFIGTMDIYEWNNNIGSFSFTAHRVGNVSLVK